MIRVWVMGAFENKRGSGFWQAIVAANERTENLQIEEIVAAIEELPIETKAELVRRLQVSSKMSITSGASPSPESLIIQISLRNKESISTILREIADRLGGLPR
jgi:hypothetical protein